MGSDEALPLPPRPASLRGLYSPPLSDWSFNPPPGGAGASSSSPSPSSSPTAWSTRPSKPHVLDLSPYPIDELDSGTELPNDARAVLRWLVGSALLQYATTGIAMPFEVAKILMQCQWIPKEDMHAGSAETLFDAPINEEDRDADSMSDDSAESYFHDPAREAFATTKANRRRTPPTTSPAVADEDGYVLRHSVYDDSTRPDYIIPIGPTDGVWDMIKRVGKWKHEGWLALWKAQLTSTVIETVTPVLQSTLQTLLANVFMQEAMPSYPLPPSQISSGHLAITLASHIAAGVILSPLDLVRTRLIVQSSHDAHRSYSGPISALRSIIKNEGGLTGLYTHPHLLIPAILDSSIRPFLTLATPYFLHHIFGITEESHPLSYALSQLLVSTASLLVTLPIETIRRRLQIQIREGDGSDTAVLNTKQLQACIETRPTPYNGIVDAAYRIVTEERSDPLPSAYTRFSTKGKGKGKEPAREEAEVKSTSKTEEEDAEGWLSGVSQLYRGLWMGVTANTVVFVLSTFAGGSGGSDAGGWTEL